MLRNETANGKAIDGYRFNFNLIDEIPVELRDAARWLVWRVEHRANQRGEVKATKVPYQSREPQRKADSTDATTWSTFDEAVETVRGDESLAGVGIVFSPDTRIVGIDWDGCFGPTAQPERVAWAEKWRSALGASFTESSPSGEGLKSWYRSENGLPPRPGAKAGETGRNCRRLSVEVYDRARFFTVTGQIHGAATIGPINEGALRDLLAEIDAKPTTPRKAPSNPTTPSTVREPAKRSRTKAASANGRKGIVARDGSDHADLDDGALLAKIRMSEQGAEFAALFDQGEWRSLGFPSPSEADDRLANHLAFWTDCDPERVERLFGMSKLAERGKWRTRPGYRAATIGHAIEVVRAARESREAERPEIRVTTQERAVNDQMVEALAADPALYTFGNKLVRVLRTPPAPGDKTLEDEPGPRISIIKTATLREHMAASARWMRFDGRSNDWKPAQMGG